LEVVLQSIDGQFPARKADEKERNQWLLARAMLRGYARRYPQEEFEVIELEKEFECEIRNPDTGGLSQSFSIAGKVDGIVRVGRELFLLEHKTASCVSGEYIDKLWTDTQIALYCHYLRKQGYPIVGVIYNVLLKSKIKQRQGETEEEFEFRKSELARKNKSGKSSAKRKIPETDQEFEDRLTEWYARDEAFVRERIFLNNERLAMLQDEVWTITQHLLDARRREKFLMNTSNCFSYQRPCEYLPYCRSGFSPLILENLYEIVAPHEELQTVSESTSGF
jgi:hypothetical protein